MTIPWSSISYALLMDKGKGAPGVEIVTTTLGSVTVPCKSTTAASLVYQLFVKNPDIMLNSALMRDASIISSQLTQPSLSSQSSKTISFSSSPLSTVTQHDLNVLPPSLSPRVNSLQRGSSLLTTRKCGYGYAFSSANNRNILNEVNQTQIIPTCVSDLLYLMRQRLESVSTIKAAEDERILDESLWWLIFSWNQYGFSAISFSPQGEFNNGAHVGVCCVALLLNHSTSVLYLRRADVIAGQGAWLIPSPAVSSDQSVEQSCSSSVVEIPPASYCIAFASAGSVSTYDSGNLEVVLSFTSFDSEKKNNFVWNVSNQASRCKVHKKETSGDSGVRVEFVEKTTAENWSKFVVAITDAS